MKVLLLVLLLLFPVSASAHYEGELLPDSVAVTEYQMVIRLNPKDTLTRNKLGMVYVRQDKPDKARAEFIEILRISPADFDALDSLGIVADRQGRYAEAADWFRKALKVRPGDAGAKQRLERALSKSGKR